ncbi:RNA polymerase sigma factor [Crateriforma conspicua]|uniref:RNA polymerase sigma-28 factor n=1 Tax=Crateriforma conspicua TaxID=2527996 RepID=A0A5C5Y2N4_9PLAN|nr:sigma-70 family RNA polymerase sigma factor [Crateriforma conspicua]QDV63569.1 RNA polymerase sigma-28 factor precursor [Crateriforma conspicua]TWT68933.1 RNA polymerase sigma-28 factor precursor [Crateriforma conspicua]
MNLPGETSHSLLRHACDAGDAQAWEQLFDHYRRFILYILNELGVDDNDIDDVAQQIWLSLTRDLRSYDSGQSRFRTWLSTVIRNAAMAHFRKRKNRESRICLFGEPTPIDAFAQPAEIDQRIEMEWEAYVANMAMERVQEVFQGQAVEVFQRGLDGQSADEIAAATGLSVASVYTLRKRVKKRLYVEIRALETEMKLDEAPT